MSEQKRCNRCERAIDEWAKICPFCNWDQTSADAPPPLVVPAAVAAYRPPDEFEWKKKLIFAGGGLIVLILAFVIGMVINEDGAPASAPQTAEEQAAAEKKAGPVKRADTPLVPANEPGGIEQPITSAPVAAQAGTPGTDYQRTDATAVSAADYAEMATRARAEKKKMAVLVDPRSLTGPAYAQTGDRPRRVAPMQSSQGAPGIPGAAPAPNAAPAPQRGRTYRTRPVPEYQPLPQLSVQGKARLSVLVGADGRVKEVDLERPLAHDTARLIQAVQSWRFKPATENGEPIASRYSVEISFNR
jgi:protein TonB